MQQDTASENISKQFGYVLVPWSSTITPVWSCEHLLAKTNVWSTPHYSSWELSSLHWTPSSWEDRAVWEALVSLGQPWSSAARSLCRSSAELCLKAPALTYAAVVLAPCHAETPIFFSFLEKHTLLLLQGHISAHGKKSQSTMNMSWEQLKANSILGCCTASPVSSIDNVLLNLKSFSLENIQLSQIMLNCRAWPCFPSSGFK